MEGVDGGHSQAYRVPRAAYSALGGDRRRGRQAPVFVASTRRDGARKALLHRPRTVALQRREAKATEPLNRGDLQWVAMILTHANHSFVNACRASPSKRFCVADCEAGQLHCKPLYAVSSDFEECTCLLCASPYQPGCSTMVVNLPS